MAGILIEREKKGRKEERKRKGKKEIDTAAFKEGSEGSYF